MLFNKLREYKLSYEVYNFFQRKALMHNIPLFKKYGIKKKYYQSISSQDFVRLNGEKNKYDVVDSREFLSEHPKFKSLPQSYQESLLDWSRNGYAILEHFFSEEEITEFNDEIDRLIQSKKAKWQYGNKIMFAIHDSKTLKDAGDRGRLTSILGMLMDKKVNLFQSINFLDGSQQRTHSDSIHMTTFPLGNLIAVWVALEDIQPDSGPLHYYPGSHKLPYILNEDFGNLSSKLKLGDKDYNDYENKIQDVLESNNFQKKVFLPRKGDILIWHANLLHGGEIQTNPNASRKSMVFHYYSEDVICYHEITERPTLFL